MRGGFEKGFVAAVLALAGFFGAIFLLQQMPELKEQTTLFIALLFFPLLIYVLISGVISEISGPGGWGAKFHDIAKEPVTLSTEVLPLQFVTKGELQQIKQQLDKLDPRVPVAILLKVDLGDTTQPADNSQLQGLRRGFDPFDLAEYLKAFLEVDPDLTIVYVDKKGRFQASSDALSVTQLEDADNHLHRFVENINTYDPTEIRKIVPLTSRKLKDDRSNATALKAMNADGVRSIVVVDEFSKPIGVVRRDALVSRLMESLVS